jgi:hypothetical protein
VTINAQAFQNGTHQTSSIGDSFTFSYTGKFVFMSSLTSLYLSFGLIRIGTNMTVYGILPRPDGSLSLSYTIDGGNATTVSHKIIDSTTDTLNHPMLQTGPLVAGNHTIAVTLTDIITSYMFIVDYITYVPSFQSLAAMPDLSNSSSEPLRNSTSTSNTSSPSASESSSSNNSPASTSRSSGSNHLRVDAIAGGIGGFACLAIIVTAVFFFIRRCRHPSETKNNRADSRLSQ